MDDTKLIQFMKTWSHKQMFKLETNLRRKNTTLNKHFYQYKTIRHTQIKKIISKIVGWQKG